MRNTTAMATGTADATFSSAWFYIGNMSKFSVITNVTGAASPSGTVYLNVSNEAAPGGSQMPYTPTVYGAQPTFSYGVNNNGCSISAVFDCAYQWGQLIYSRTSGSGGVIQLEFAAHD
jgi:hypothetical protein